MRRLWPDPEGIDDIAAFVASAPRSRPSGRPWLLVNMISSLDGAIAIDGRSGGLGRPADKAMFSALRGVADLVLAGAGTVRAEGYGPPRPSAATRAARLERGQAEVPRLGVVSLSLDLDPGSPMFTDAATPPLVITCEAAPAARRQRLEAVAEVVVAGAGTVDPLTAMARLDDLGIGTVCCEGGPTLNATLVVADVVDEWALTVSPLLVGGDSARSSAGPWAPEPRTMNLDWVIEGDGLLLTRWVRQRS